MSINRRKMSVANAVLNIVESYLSVDDEHIWLEAYSNGREQGYCLNRWGKYGNKNIDFKVSFAENRNSDQIVVYFGTSGQFGMQGNTPDEEVYKRRKHFSHNQQYEADMFIVGLLRGEKP